MGRVTLEKVGKEYSDVVAVDDLSIEIEDGEFVTLVGPSGCGKSTTLESIAGLTNPTEGRILIGDNDVTDLPPKNRDISMVFQNIALFPHLDVFDNISYGLQIRGEDRELVEEKVQEALETLQLDGMGDRMPDELSGGQRQRVGIGRAIVRDPAVFLMDEPLANLDAKLRVHMRTEIQRIQRQLDVTTIYVTHDQEEAMTMSDRIAVMNSGELQQIASPLECYNQPANIFVAGFIGSPSMNFYSGVVEGQLFQSGRFSQSIELPPMSGMEEGDELTIGIRPEDIYPSAQADELSHPSAPLQAQIDVIEPLGDEMLVYLLFDDDRAATVGDLSETEDSEEMLMAVGPDANVEEGDHIEVVFDRANLHVFDSKSGNALAHGIVEPPEEATDSPSTAVGRD